MPFIFLVHGKSTCRELQLQVFRLLYPIINFPKELTKKLEKLKNEDDRIEFAYKMAFEESSFADEELYELVLINNRDSSEG
jgi:5,10-methylenetetrahydrofolate reductase